MISEKLWRWLLKNWKTRLSGSWSRAHTQVTASDRRAFEIFFDSRRAVARLHLRPEIYENKRVSSRNNLTFCSFHWKRWTTWPPFVCPGKCLLKWGQSGQCGQVASAYSWSFNRNVLTKTCWQKCENKFESSAMVSRFKGARILKHQLIENSFDRTPLSFDD